MKSKDWATRLLYIQIHRMASCTPFRLFRTKVELGEKTDVESYGLSLAFCSARILTPIKWAEKNHWKYAVFANRKNLGQNRVSPLTR